MVAIAPEGMTSNGRQLLKFRTGAFAPAVPVLPVCISYQWKRLNPAWTICSELWHIVRLFTQFINFATVEVLPARTPDAAEALSAATFASNVRQGMVRRAALTSCCTAGCGLDLLTARWSMLVRAAVECLLQLIGVHGVCAVRPRCCSAFLTSWFLEQVCSSSSQGADTSAVQSDAMSKPTESCGIAEYHALMERSVYVDWRGKLAAPPGVIDADGYVALPQRPQPRASLER
jgi:hypothetical protein